MMKKYKSANKRLLLLIGLLLAFLLVLNFSTYALYKRAKAYLDNELGERLQSIAVMLSHTVELANSDLSSGSPIKSDLYSLLYTAKSENFLSNILILTPEGTTILDLENISETGKYNPFVDLDFSAVTLAKSGFPSATVLYKSGSVYMKSAYAPIRDVQNDIIGIMGVEAGAVYFGVLKSLRSAIILVDAASVIVVLLLGLFFFKQSVSLDRALEAVLRGENLATMGRMVAGVAHEIRNPLSIIKAASERIRSKYQIEDETFSYISDEVDELDRILTGYLNFAKAEPQDLQPHALQKIVKRCILLIESETSDKKINLAYNGPKQDITINCDDKHIQQALLNILINAVQAVRPEGDITVTVSADESHGRVSVEDSGHGIDERDITKPFYTTKKHGSGLGLSIVTNIVKSHQGQMNIESKMGVGTKVIISFPLQRTRKRAENPKKEA
jgi:signal transduction histidine kinase